MTHEGGCTTLLLQTDNMGNNDITYINVAACPAYGAVTLRSIAFIDSPTRYKSSLEIELLPAQYIYIGISLVNKSTLYLDSRQPSQVIRLFAGHII